MLAALILTCLALQEIHDLLILYHFERIFSWRNSFALFTWWAQSVGGHNQWVGRLHVPGTFHWLLTVAMTTK